MRIAALPTNTYTRPASGQPAPQPPADDPQDQVNFTWGAIGAVAGAIPMVGAGTNALGLAHVENKIAAIENPLVRGGVLAGAAGLCALSLVSPFLPAPYTVGISAANAALGAVVWSRAEA